MQNELTDKYLSEQFKNDELICKPDPAIKSRLDYTFLLKESQSKIRQNSFTGLFSWFFSLKNIPVKAALLSVVLFISVFNFQQKTGNFNTPTIDSTLFLTIPFYADSVVNKPFRGDTCSFPGM